MLFVTPSLPSPRHLFHHFLLQSISSRPRSCGPWRHVSRSSAGSWVCNNCVQQPPPLSCFQLKAKITRAMAAREQKQRKRSLQKYIPDCCNAIWAVLEAMAGAVPRGPKRQRVEGQTDVISKVRGRLGTSGGGGLV